MFTTACGITRVARCLAWACMAIILSSSLLSAQDEAKFACPESAETIKMQELEDKVGSLIGEGVVAGQAEAQQKLDLLKDRLDLRRKSLAVGECDTSSDDQIIVRLAKELDELTGPDVPNEVSIPSSDAETPNTPQEPADSPEESIGVAERLMVRLLTFLFDKMTVKKIKQVDTPPAVKERLHSFLSANVTPVDNPVPPPSPKRVLLYGVIRTASADGRPLVSVASPVVKNARIKAVEWRTETESRGDGSFSSRALLVQSD